MDTKQLATVMHDAQSLRLNELAFANLFSGIALLASAGENVNIKVATICAFC